MRSSHPLTRFFCCGVIAGSVIGIAGLGVANAQTDAGGNASTPTANGMPTHNGPNTSGQSGIRNSRSLPSATNAQPGSSGNMSANQGPASDLPAGKPGSSNDNGDYGSANYKAPSQIQPSVTPPGPDTSRPSGNNPTAPVTPSGRIPNQTGTPNTATSGASDSNE